MGYLITHKAGISSSAEQGITEGFNSASAHLGLEEINAGGEPPL